jgi:hypothetical protein
MRASKKHAKGLPTAEQEELAVSTLAAERALAKLPQAAIDLASEKRMRQFVDVANRIHMP